MLQPGKTKAGHMARPAFVLLFLMELRIEASA